MKTQIYLSILLSTFLASRLAAQCTFTFTDALAVDTDGAVPLDFNPLAALTPVCSLAFDIDGDGAVETLSFSTTSNTGIPVIFPLGASPANIPFPANTLSSQPGTGASLPITISFNEPISTFTFDLIDPNYITPEVMADIAGLSLSSSTLADIIEALDSQGDPRGTRVEAFDNAGNSLQVNFIIEDYDPVNPIAPLPVSQLPDLSTQGGPVAAVSIPGPGDASLITVLRVTIFAAGSPFMSLKISAAVPGTTGVPTSGDFILLDNFGHCPDGDGDGFTTCNGDCDDDNPNNFPSNTETCDGQDNNCDGQIDEGYDADNDGITDCSDNCVNTSNPTQADSDCDGVGNACDQWPGCGDNEDSDNDGTPDCVDLDEMANWACGNNGDKVTVCHIPPGNPANRHEICISPNAVESHLDDHGDYIGECDQVACPQSLMAPTGNSTVSTGFLLYPNPAKGTLHLDLHDYLDQRISVFIFNQLGQRVFYLPEQELSDSHLTIDLARLALPDGIYLFTVRTAEGVEGRQFVIAR